MFLQDILAGWCKINASENTNVIAKEIIWNNPQLKCKNKILFYLNWYNTGITFIDHKMFLEFKNIMH